jgi:hypothetical protein
MISNRPASTSPTESSDLAASDVTGTAEVGGAGGASRESIGRALHGSMAATMTTPVPTDLDAIAQLQDGAVRNLLITQRYHDLSQALIETIGPGNVNWSTFATWASKTAGLSIRNEEVPPFVNELAGARLFLLDPVRETLGTVSQSIADGNRKVYAELAPLFARFVQVFRDTPGAGDAELAAFVGGLNPAPSSTDNGQAPLIPAFTAYYTARSTKDPVAHARLLLLGNCLIGLHEQTRLDPQIRLAMDAPIDDIVRKHLKPGSGGGFLTKIIDAVERPLEELTNLAQTVWEEIATRTMMSLSLPGGQTLPLGKDIPRIAARRQFLPAPLRDIVDPADLVALLDQYDRARGDTDQNTASIDWRKLEDRMNFIVNLFRSRQQDRELLDPPFSPAQCAAIEQRKMPEAALGKL